MKNFPTLVLGQRRWLNIAEKFDYPSFLPQAAPRPANYLLKNGEWSQETVYDQEAGIFISPDLYLDLVNYTTDLMTFAEAERFCVEKQVQLPKLCELYYLQHISKTHHINCAFYRINMYPVPDKVFSSCWYEEVSETTKQNEKRRLLVIKSRSGVQAKSLVINHGEAMVLANGNLLVKDQGECYVHEDYKLLAVDQGLQLLSGADKYVFALKGLELSYLGDHPQYAAEDALLVSGKALQIYNGELVEFAKGLHSLGGQGKALVGAVWGDSFYGGGEQYINERTYYTYEKNDQGMYVQTDEKYYT